MNTSKMKEYYNNYMFGGSLIEQSKRVVNLNPLRHDICYKEHFGLYNIPNVKASNKIFYDI